MAIVELSNQTFNNEVEDENGAVLVDFWAPWCGPCKRLAPILDEVDSEMGDKIKILKVNVDDNPDVAGKYGVMSIPTLMVFKNGEVQAKMAGFQEKDQLIEWLQEYVEHEEIDEVE